MQGAKEGCVGVRQGARNRTEEKYPVFGVGLNYQRNGG